MERNDDELTLEGLDDQIEWHARGLRALPPGGPPSPTTRLIQGLRRSYENEQADEQSVEAVWQRLAERGAVPAPARQRASHPRRSQPETWQPLRQSERRPRRWTLASRLTVIAAAVVLVVVIGGLAVGLILVRQPKVGVTSQPTATSTQQVAVTSTPTTHIQTLAYIGSDHNIWVMTWPGGTPKQLTTDSVPTNHYSWLAWSPDGSLLAAAKATVSDGIGSMVILKPDGTVVVNVPLPGYHVYDIPFVWSPDSTMLAFRGDVTAGPTNNGLRKLLLFNAHTGQVMKTLTYEVGGTGGCGGGGPVSELTLAIWSAEDEGFELPHDAFVWSPDGHSLLLTRVALGSCARGQGIEIDLSTGATNAPYPFLGSYQPGGNLILGYWSDGTLGLTDLSANHVRALVKPEPSVNPPQYMITMGLAVWANDGQNIYYEHNDSIWQIGVDASNPHQVVGGTALDSQENATVQLLPRPSPDGNMLLYLQATGSNRAVDSFDPTPQPTPTEPLTTRWYIAQADGTNPTPLPSGISDVVWRPAK